MFAGRRVLAGDVLTRSPGRTSGSFSMKRRRGRLLPWPTSKAWLRERGNQTPISVPGAVSSFTLDVAGVTLAIRPIKPPGPRTASPGLMPCIDPLPRSNCCHQPLGDREITAAAKCPSMEPRCCRFNIPRRRWLSCSSKARRDCCSRSEAAVIHSRCADPGQNGRLSKA